MTADITAERFGDRIEIRLPFHLKDVVKLVPGAKWDRAANVWWAPLTWAACVSLRGVFGDRLAVGEALAVWALEERRTRVDVCMSLRDALDHQDAVLDELHQTSNLHTLWPFQRGVVAFLAAARSALLASEMGTGKTPVGLMALRYLQATRKDALPALIVTPNTVKRTWAEEAKIWAPELDVRVVTGGAAARRKMLEEPADVFIINWEALRAHSRLAPYGSTRLKRCAECGGADKSCEVHERELNRIDFGAVIADEAHRAKSPKALQTRALWAVGAKARYRFALTGTPIANRVDDLWSIMHFIDPAEWDSRTRYVDRFALTAWNPFGGLEIVGVRPDTADEFFKILHPRMRRDLKAVAMPDLPVKSYQTRFLEATPKQAKAYREMQKEMIAELDSGLVTATDPLVKALRLWQLASSMIVMDPTGRSATECLEPSCKVDALLELIEESAGQPLVAFAESRLLIELCERVLTREKIGFVSIHGNVDEVQRQDNIEKFQRGGVPVCLATIKAGGVGITLTRAHAAVFLQRSWSAVDNRQAEDRVHRGGLDHPVTVIDLVTNGTVEELRVTGLLTKEMTLQEIVRDADALRAMLTTKGV